MNDKEKRERYLSLMLASERDPRHGTSKGYKYGCRCDRCKAAMREAHFERKAREQHKLAQPQAFIYAFPEHRHAAKIRDNMDLFGQAARIGDEVEELLAAVSGGEGSGRVLEDCLDVVHACETLLRAWPAEEVFKARNAVIAKNDSRGYYLRKETR